MKHTWFRVIYLSNVQGERANLALFVYDEDGNFAWRQARDITKAAVFMGCDETVLRTGLDFIRADLLEKSPFGRHTFYTHYYSDIQVDTPHVYIGGASVESVADTVSASFLRDIDGPDEEV